MNRGGSQGGEQSCRVRSKWDRKTKYLSTLKRAPKEIRSKKNNQRKFRSKEIPRANDPRRSFMYILPCKTYETDETLTIKSSQIIRPKNSGWLEISSRASPVWRDLGIEFVDAANGWLILLRRLPSSQAAASCDKGCCDANRVSPQLRSCCHRHA